MSNSSLVSYRRWSPNHYNGRGGYRISKITVHHMAGNLSVEACGNVFANSARQASSNYGIGTDGRIGQYVDEANAAWTSSNYTNDCMAVTIEVANSQVGGDWPVSQAAWNSLVNLCVDICRRNGIRSLNWTGNSNGNLTCHYMFASTACPGPYLKARMGELARQVNAILAGSATAPSAPPAGTGGGSSWSGGSYAEASTKLRYRVSTDPNGRNWYAEMENYKDLGGTSDDFAGDGTPIRWIAINMPSGSWYQVKTQKSGWLPRVYSYNINDLDYGCAGDGSPITAIRCYYNTINPGQTGWMAIQYQVSTSRGWYSNMVDLRDTGGSSDDFAGDGANAVTKFRARLVKV